MERDDHVSKERLNNALKGQYPQPRHEYDKVFVHLIYWEESDDPGFEKEAQELQALFEGFNYHVDHFKIPSLRSQLSLAGDIVNFCLKVEENRCLGIIHYGGHADKDDNRGQKQRAVWTA